MRAGFGSAFRDRQLLSSSAPPMHAASCGIAAPCNGCFVVDSWMMAEGRPRRVVVRRAQGGMDGRHRRHAPSPRREHDVCVPAVCHAAEPDEGSVTSGPCHSQKQRRRAERRSRWRKVSKSPARRVQVNVARCLMTVTPPRSTPAAIRQGAPISRAAARSFTSPTRPLAAA